MNRGEYLSVYAKSANGARQDMRACPQAHYSVPFVWLAREGLVPATRHVRGSNLCELAAFDDRLPARVILFSALDNLVKGSSGQAVQNLNIMFGFDETEDCNKQPLNFWRSDTAAFNWLQFGGIAGKLKRQEKIYGTRLSAYSASAALCV